MTRNITTVFLFFLAVACCASPDSSAAPITVPTDLNLGDHYRLAFVTSTTRDATSSDIADYNAFVAGVAAGQPELAALGTTWTAIAATATVNAYDNTSTYPSYASPPIYRLDDTRLTDNNGQLWGGHSFANMQSHPQYHRKRDTNSPRIGLDWNRRLRYPFFPV